MSKRIRERSQLQEKRAAKDIGGRTVAGSGAAKFSGGGDVRKQGELRVECKFTEKSYYDLKYSDLVKIQTQALKAGMERPVMQVEFVSGLCLKLAIEPAFIHADKAPFTRTTNKQVRLNKDEVYKALLGDGFFQIVFVDNDMSKAYTVRLWDDFVAELEEEEC